MKNFLKLNFFILITNIGILFFLVVGIQNGSTKTKINLIFSETVNLPLPFLMGTSFVFGSTIGGLISSIAKFDSSIKE